VSDTQQDQHQPERGEAEQPWEHAPPEASESLSGLMGQRLGEFQLLIGIPGKIGRLGFRVTMLESSARLRITADCGERRAFEGRNPLAVEVPLFRKSGLLDVSLLNGGIAVTRRLEQLALDLEYLPRLTVCKGLQVLVMDRGAGAGDARLALPGPGFEPGFRGFKGGSGFSDAGGARFLELLAPMIVLTFQPDELAAAFLVRFPNGRHIGFEGATQPIQQLEASIQVQQVIHSPS
jgi:hypothetical protein